MTILQIIILAIIQGITEFLPISSSAHLIFPSLLLGWQDQGLVFDVAVHFGTLIAVVFYLRRELLSLSRGWCQSLLTRKLNDDGRLAWGLLVATLPAGLAGLILDDYVELYLRSLLVIAATTLIFGVLLGWADKHGRREVTLEQLGWRSILIIGIAQMFALIPGTSRSGVTMTAGLWLGLTREASAKFSFLLSVPIIASIACYKSLKLILADTSIAWAEILLGAGLSAVVAFLCIRWFVDFVNRVGFMPFVIYRLVLGVLLLAIYAFGSL